MESSRIEHPSHYTQGKIEVIDFIEDQKLDFRLANAVKYICRAGKKDPLAEVEDLKKAVWYINRYIEKTGEQHVKEAKQKMSLVLGDSLMSLLHSSSK